MEDPDPAEGILLKLIFLFFLIMINAFFAMSEIAIITLNDNKVDRMANEGNKKAKSVLKLTKNSSNFLSTIQIGVTIAGFLTSASASQSFVDNLSGVIHSTGIYRYVPSGFINSVSVVIITVIVSYFSLVFGEIVPKKIGMHAPEKVSFMVVGILLFFAKITKPFVKVLSLSANGIVKIFGIDPNSNIQSVTEEEIRMLVDVGGERGVIEDVQKEMINNIFEFDDIDVGDIMTHRTDMAAVEADDSLEDVLTIAIDEGYSRIPVFDDDPDNIIGIVYVKDLLKFIGNDLPEKTNLREIMRSAYYVPESKRCGELFAEMTSSHVQMAVVVDEYGGTAGIVTLEDLLESIVGNIQDEYDNEVEEISRIDETTFTIDGTTDIDEVENLVGNHMPEGDYDTLGGYIISELGFLPKNGEFNVVEFENIRFTVLNVEERRIGRIKVEILPDDENETDEDKENTKKRRVDK
ncbi:MAG TPA: hemolysin family protein [Clostridia bacterium]|nr:hemolysin family protein [Clostridia bacterium]